MDGEAIAIPSKDTPPITPDQMPPTITAQALKHIKSRLGELVAITGDQDPLSDEQRQDDATANAIPIAQQESKITPTALPKKSAPPLPVIPLLSKGGGGLSVVSLAGNMKKSCSGLRMKLRNQWLSSQIIHLKDSILMK